MRRAAKKVHPAFERNALERLEQAIERYAIAYGEAQWTNGYRTANPAKEEELWPREQAQWKAVGKAHDVVVARTTAYRRAVREAVK